MSYFTNCFNNIYYIPYVRKNIICFPVPALIICIDFAWTPLSLELDFKLADTPVEGIEDAVNLVDVSRDISLSGFTEESIDLASVNSDNVEDWLDGTEVVLFISIG